jgi:hypothetical protein
MLYCCVCLLLGGNEIERYPSFFPFLFIYLFIFILFANASMNHEIKKKVIIHRNIIKMVREILHNGTYNLFICCLGYLLEPQVLVINDKKTIYIKEIDIF